MKIAITIPVFNQIDLLQKCLASIAANLPKHDEVEIVLVNNGSTEDITPALKSAGVLKVSIIHNRRNQGVTIPWNQGLDAALEGGADVVCVCNSDVVFGPDVLQDCSIAAILRGVSFPLSIQGGPMPKQFDVIAQTLNDVPLDRAMKVTGGFAGWCFFLARDVIAEIGRFDDNFTLWYQDTDYHNRLRAKDYQPVEVRSCLIHHFESQTILSLPQQFDSFGWRAADQKHYEKKYAVKL